MKAVRLDPPVLNQFHFDGDRGRRACVPLCLLALFHIAEEIRDRNNYQCDTILNEEQWTHVMALGIKLWHLWKKKTLMVDEVFPKIEEILALPQCDKFYTIFKKEEDLDKFQRAGLAIDSKYHDNPLGSLQHLCESMTKENRNVYAVVVLPEIAYAIALFYHRCLSTASSFYLFDPHGRKGSEDNNITLVRFFDCSELVRYIIKRYDIKCIDTYVPFPGQKKKIDETELMTRYAYTASLFTTLSTSS